MEINRVIVIVLDSVGIGELPDAADFGDVGSHTLGNMARVVGGLNVPHMEQMGLGNIAILDGVIPQEELFLQGSMSARMGADSYQMLRALTTHPAQAFGIADRVGSLEVGKDADVVITRGDPLDPRSRVELVLIDGKVEYDGERDGPLF